MFVADKQALLSCIQTVQRGTGKVMPILSAVKIEAGESLSFTTTNLESYTTSYLTDVQIDEPGSICIPVRELSNLAKKLPDGIVRLSVEDFNATLHYGEAKAVLNGYDPDEFPSFPHISDAKSFVLSADALQSIARVLYCVGRDELRPIFTGVLLQTTGDSLTAVSTDTHRLAVAKIDIPCVDGNVIIPGKALAEVVNIFEGDVNVSLAENYVTFYDSSKCLLTRLIEGQFPDYTQVIPTVHSVTLNDVDPVALKEVVERASAVCEKDAIVILDIQDKTTLSTKTERGKVTEQLSYTKTGDDVRVGVNAKYLAEMLKSCGDGMVDIDFTGKASPIVIRVVDERSEYTALTLPVRVEG